MAGKGITFLAVVLLLGLAVDAAAASPFVRTDRNATAAGDDCQDTNGVSSRLHLDSDVPLSHGEDLTRTISSRGGASAGPTTAAGAGAGAGTGAAAFGERYSWKTFVAIDSAQGGLRRLDSDSNAPGVAVYIAVFVVAVVLFLVCLRACGVGAICIPISCC